MLTRTAHAPETVSAPRTAARHTVATRLSDEQEQALTALLVAASDTVTPCTGNAAFIADSPDVQRRTAARCSPCPILGRCRAYGLAWPREAGVLGGLTEADRNIRRTTTRPKGITTMTDKTASTPTGSNRFATWRAREGLTVHEVAALTGVSRDTLGRIEHEGHDPAPRIKLALARGLGVPLDRLFAPPTIGGAA